VEQLTVEALVPVGTPAYEEYADGESLFSMVIPLAAGEGQFFMCHQQWRDTWELPSGKLEPGESPLQAAERELLEELGAQVDRFRPLGILLTRLAQAPAQGHLYWGKVVQRDDLPPGSEMDKVRVFSLDMLPVPEQMAPVTRWVVRWMGHELIATGKGETTSWIWD